ncbi:hypothetical protein Syun_028438 [Stephania yunnanensis]|uniref:Uncharacterized protein n=1 Tax=Stephania yunnanensis TaxID=152371 RepID=A0AAP0EML9_9MAGN
MWGRKMSPNSATFSIIFIALCKEGMVNKAHYLHENVESKTNSESALQTKLPSRRMSSSRPDICQLIDWIGTTKVVALGLVASAEAKALADHVPLSPQTMVV